MIPILFNHDDTNNEKKGNVRAQDLATILSILTPQRVGVLNVFTNPCDAYQVNVSTGFATVTFHKGYVCVYGRLIYVEEGEQVQVQIPTDTSTVTGSFGIRINLAETGDNEVTWFTKTTSLQQDDLTNNEIDGVYEFLMYTYTAKSNSLVLTKRFSLIDNTAEFMKGTNYITKPNATKDTSPATTEFVHNLIDGINWNYRGFVMGGAYSGYQEATHWYKIIDIFNLRIICGNVYGCAGNRPTFVWWNPGDSMQDTKIKLTSFDANYNNGQNDPFHFMVGGDVDSFLAREIPQINKPANTDGFCLFNSNGSTLTGHYLIIGVRP